ncbi:hypothetical protein HYH03_010729 [Edaphochlamys debaryana]|uniref:MYND-type domain-containing protein n=1 Tax=Edaphochlamys debaryana TaxID=47281 RepID=A0A835XWC4_9CHLO|nr:hypothetical protein HYH03_010729 [Edaphochlamys debaryana]|eukprot:KAG2490807.1 hypothetical protein HYH03_010729 [Edaphochlamys debaryana]
MRLYGRGMQSPELLFTECARIGCFLAFAIAQYLHFLAFVVEGYMVQAEDAGRYNYDPPVPQLATGLRDSKLVGGTASLILACLGPDVAILPGQTPAPADAAAAAAAAAALEPEYNEGTRKAILYFAHAVDMIGKAGNDPEHTGKTRSSKASKRLYAAFGEALVHPETARLRLAMLETVWAQAGMEPAAGPGAERRPEQGPGGGGTDSTASGGSDQGRSGSGGGGEGSGARGSSGCTYDCDERLWVHHNHVHAQLAVRTAEALGRLTRGQGLCGMYGPKQKDFFGIELTSVLFTLPTGEDMPEEGWDPRALPLWAEAITWTVAVAAEALSIVRAAGDKNYSAREHEAGPAALLPGVVDTSLQGLSYAAEHLGEDWRRAGIPRPGVPSRDAVLSRLRYAGLGAGLDHALRLACADLDHPRSPIGLGARLESDTEYGQGLDKVMQAAHVVMTNLRLDPLAPVEGQPLGEAGGALLTYAKRARVVARRLEATAAGAGGQPDAMLYLPSGSRLPPGSLTAALADCAALLRRRQEGDQGAGRSVLAALSDLRSELAPAAAPTSTTTTPSASSGTAAAELEAFLYQCTGALAARVGCDVSSLARPGDLLAGLALEDSRTAAGLALGECLHYVTRLGEACGAGQGGTGAGAEQAEGRLLACQPHRLIAAACKQLCAARSPSGAAARTAPLSSSGSGSGSGSDDAAFRQAATTLLGWMRAQGEEPWGLGGLTQPPPYDARELFRDYGIITAPAAQRAAAVVLDEALPPALEAPPQGRVWAQLRVCGFPGCMSYGGRSEADLPLKQCGGCKAVRYCGPECQRAHWREGHQGECGALAAAVRAGKGQVLMHR